jgi:fatty acid-binding protein DegV
MSFDADSERLRVLIGCGLTPADGHFVAAELERRLPAGSIESIVFTEMGPAIGVHGGPETILVALQPMPRG